MTFIEKNIKAIGNAKAQIMQSPNEDTTGILISNSTTPKGLPTLKISSGENSYYVHSAYDPQRESEKLIEKLDFSKNALFIVYGLGLGYHLFEIKKKTSQGSLVIVIEPSKNAFQNAMQTTDMSQVFQSENFIFLVGFTEEEVCAIFADFSREMAFVYLAPNMQFFILSAYDKLFPGMYKNLSTKIINSSLYAWHTLGNSITDTLLGLVQSFSNIDVLIENAGINQLTDKYKNKPAIIVSAGPSLDKNVHLLKEAQGKALIIATDAVVEMLIKKGIIPDAVVCFERYLNYEHLFKGRSFPEEIVLVGLPLLEPQVLKVFEKNRKVVCIKQDDTNTEWVEKIVGPKGNLQIGNCVAHMAFGVARKVKANPIIFIGQDLAFGSDLKTHSSGVSDEVKEVAEKGTVDSNMTTVASNDGTQIPSTIMWKTFLTWFEANILKDPATTYINATEGGARINGTKTMTLKDVINQYCTSNIPALIDLLPEKVEVDKVKMYNQVIDQLQKKISYFKKIYDLSTDTHVRIEKLKKSRIQSDTDIMNVLVQTDNIIKLISDDDIAMLFFQAMISDLIVAVNNLGVKVTENTILENVSKQGEFLFLIKESSLVIINTLFELLEGFQKKAANPGIQNVFEEVTTRVSQNLHYVLQKNRVL